MKDSQRLGWSGVGSVKYIKANNERFSTSWVTTDAGW